MNKQPPSRLLIIGSMIERGIVVVMIAGAFAPLLVLVGLFPPVPASWIPVLDRTSVTLLFLLGPVLLFFDLRMLRRRYLSQDTSKIGCFANLRSHAGVFFTGATTIPALIRYFQLLPQPWYPWYGDAYAAWWVWIVPILVLMVPLNIVYLFLKWRWRKQGQRLTLASLAREESHADL